MQAYVRRTRSALVCMASLVLLLSSVLLLLHPAMAAGDAITVTRSVFLDTLADKDEIWLAGLTTRPDAVELADSDALALVWRKDVSGWLPMWHLELTSSQGLLPAGLPTRVQGDVSAATLASLQPAAGHTYEVTLSYSAPLGALAIQVYDVTAELLLYSDGFDVPPSELPVFAAGGIATPRYLPVATRWQVGVGQSGTSFIALNQFATTSEDAVVLLTVPSVAPGEYRLYHVDESGETLLAAIEPSVGEYLIPLNLLKLPIGTSFLRLDYVQDGELVSSSIREMVIGRLDFTLHPLQPERDQGVAKMQVAVSSDEPFTEEILVDLYVTLFELVWDEELRRFHEVPRAQNLSIGRVTLDMSQGATILPLELPFPDDAANWKVVIAAEVTPELIVRLGVHERLFSSHLPAKVLPGDSYVIAVFPDTQHMAQDYPEVYTRMTDWVSANAAELNIAAVLHVGDITNDNTPQEWANAHRSMSLLHGVVPYMLVLGNHDMSTVGSGGAVRERGLSLIDRYFTVGEARRYNHLMDTRVPGRLENHYYRLSIGDDEYLIISLEFGPPDEAVDWAYEVASRYPDHRMVLLTHSYTSTSGGLSRGPESYEIATNPNTTVNTAVDLWRKLVRTRPNSFMVVSGHTWPPRPVVPYRVATTDAGRPVFELLFDWQREPNGGNGWMGLLTFHADNTLEVRVYSPYLGEFAASRDANGFTSHVIFALDTGVTRRLLDP